MLVSSVIRDAVKRFPNDPSLHLIADFLYTAPEDFRNDQLALQFAQQGIKLDPTNELAIQSKCWALFGNRRWSQCIEAAEALKSKNENDFVLAICNWQLGHKDEAVECFKRGAKNGLLDMK